MRPRRVCEVVSSKARVSAVPSARSMNIATPRNRSSARRFLPRVHKLWGPLTLLLLVGFHAVLLGSRLADESIRRPDVVGRWLMAAFLLVSAGVMRTVARSRWDERRTRVIFWSLVALLHFMTPGVEVVPTSASASLVVLAGSALPGFFFLLAFILAAIVVESRRSRFLPSNQVLYATPFCLPSQPPRAPPLF